MIRAGGAPRALPSRRLVRRLYVMVSIVVWSVMGFRFVDESRGDRARRTVDETLSGAADPHTRQHVISMTAGFFTIMMAAIGLLGFGLGVLVDRDLWFRSVLQTLGVVAAFSVVTLARGSFAGRDRQRWIASGRPQHWTPSAHALPRDRDLLVCVVLAILFAWASGESFDYRTS